MAVVTSHQAFLLGYLPAIAGVAFHGVAIAEAAQRQPALAPSAADPVRHAESLAQAAGLTPPPPPQDLHSYYDWAQRLQRDVRAALPSPGDQDAPLAAIYNLGALLGDLRLTVNLLALVHDLHLASPGPGPDDDELPWLSAQRRGLLGDLERGRVRLALLCRSPLLKLPTAVAEEAARALRDLDGDLSSRAGAEAQLRRLAQRVAAIEAGLLRPAPPSRRA